MNVLVKSQRRSFAIILFLCMQLMASAQLTANFTATPLSGCSPLVVYFTDQTTGSPTQWKWDLGNGASSTLKNPSATYFNPGTYSIKLVAKNAAGADSVIKTNYITVYANPSVKFGASDTAGCFPLNVQFSDSSVAGSGTITSWQWDFGDGSISSQQHPSHNYTAAGNYTVTLKITNSFGCVKTLSKTQYIKVANGVNAVFTNTGPSVCSAPFSIQFTNASTGPGSLTYLWSFGDGTTSTASNPSHTYSSNGAYTVSLIATSVQGCKDTIIKPNLFNVGNEQADFTAPLNACVGQAIQLINTSTPQPSAAHWNFGDGSSSTSINAIKIYNTPGLYSIKLVSDFGACTDSVTKQVVVSTTPQASFLADQTVFCKTPATVQFTSPNTGNLLWNFGDGTTSTASNPIHNYTTYGNFTVKLIVTNASGCSDTLIRPNYIQINKPAIQIHGLPQTGCVPVSANLSATVTCHEPVQTWLWNFGDGTAGNTPTPSHSYPVAGNYNITLTVVTPGGCTDSVTIVNGVRAGNKPNAQFVAQPPVVCNQYPVQFIDSSTGNVDQWHWSFDDTASSTDQNPLHVFGGIGIYSVTLIVWSNTCADTIKKIDLITVLPPIAGPMVQHNCADKYTKNFVDGSDGATSWHWDFGDGTTSTSQNPVHTYAAPGTYTVVQTVYNGICSNAGTIFVKVVDEKATISGNAIICKGMVDSLTTPLANPANITSWQWSFGDGQSSSQPAPLQHQYLNSGSYTIRLTITDVLGCVSSDSFVVNVYGPSAKFHAVTTTACLDGNSIAFVDSSFSDGQNNLVQWQWNFGNGIIQTNTVSVPVAHSYMSAGQYTVKLTVKDAYGCKDSVSFSPLVIAKPHAQFYSPDSMSCAGKTISFFNQSSGDGLQYNWNLGDGTITNLQNPIHQYNNTGTYNISLHLTDQYGCTDSAIKPAYVNISIPVASFTVSDSIGTCPPLMVHFTNLSTGYSQLTWDFGDGNSSTLVNPSHYYNTAGTFYARLIITAPGGCSDTAFQKIVVKGPSGSISYTPLNGCNPLTVNFTVAAQNSTSYVWDFSDGNTLPSSTTAATHVYTTAGEFIPRIILTDAAGCNVPIVGLDTVRVYDVAASFTSDLTTLCNNGTIQFANTSVANDYITAYQWSFGDGSFSNNVSPSHAYSGVGNYPVQLVVTTANGCTDTVTLNNAITVLEKPDVQITGNTEACMPATLSFNGVAITGNASTMAWQWNFGNNQTSTSQHPAAQSYPTDGSYTVTTYVTAQNGCKDTATQNVTVHPLPSTNAGVDASICQGSNIQLNATGATSYVWNTASSLSCLNCASPNAAPSNTAIYVVTGSNAFGCTKTDSVTITVHQPFTLKVEPGDTICVGEKVNLKASGADAYSWYPSAGVQNANSGSTTATPTTSTTYQVIAHDAANCFSDTADVFIKVWPIPTVNAGADQQVVAGDAIQLSSTSSNDVTVWQWSNAASLSCATCPVTLAKPKQTTTYTLKVKNDGGCSAQDNVTVTVICNGGNLFVPNAFSPNGDGVNDRFYPSGKGISKIKSLKVFNRWGEVVFERLNFDANDAAAGWDGLFKAQVLAPDVYVYACDVVCQNNEVLSFKGDVTLLR